MSLLDLGCCKYPGRPHRVEAPAEPSRNPDWQASGGRPGYPGDRGLDRTVCTHSGRTLLGD